MTATQTQAAEPRVDAPAGIRRKTAAGMVLVATRSLAVLGLGTGGSIVLARMLSPRDFGLVALGSVLLQYGMFLADGGLGATLIRDAREPDRLDYANAFGFQLAASLLVAVLAAAVGSQFGRVGLLAALMVTSLPILAVRAPGAIALERRLEYRPLIAIEIGETVTYYAWAITTVALGWGVWGLASAIVARAAVGSVVMLIVGPIGLLRPRLSRTRVRRLLGFGASYQAVDIIGLLRDTGVNILTPAMASVSALGFWSLVGRVLQPPLVVFQALRRVSFPGMARLREHGASTQELVERALNLSTLGAGFVLTPLAAARAGAHPGRVRPPLGAGGLGGADGLPWVAPGGAVLRRRVRLPVRRGRRQRGAQGDVLQLGRLVRGHAPAASGRRCRRHRVRPARGGRDRGRSVRPVPAASHASPEADGIDRDADRRHDAQRTGRVGGRLLGAPLAPDGR